jgi:hypothetical protein
MAAVGTLLGTIGRRFDLSRTPTMTSLLAVAVTASQLIMGSEGVINVQYVVWMRAMGAVAVLHLLFARPRAVAAASSSQADGGPPALPSVAVAGGLRYPSLMR